MDSLEHRIGLLELGQLQFKKAQIPDREDKAEDDPEFSDINISISSLFETKLGEYGLAWLRNIMLFFAIAFLWQYFNDAGKPVISLIVGIVSVTGVFVMSHYILSTEYWHSLFLQLYPLEFQTITSGNFKRMNKSYL